MPYYDHIGTDKSSNSHTNASAVGTFQFLSPLYRTSWMKYRLLRDYSTVLTVHSSNDTRVSDLVTRKDALLAEMVDDEQIITPRLHLGSATTSSTEGGCGTSGLQYSQYAQPRLNEKAELYHSALILKEM